MREIVPGVYQIGGSWGSGILGANVFLLVDDGLAIIDTGFRGTIRKILKYIQLLGRSISEVACILATHYHADHTGNLAELKKLTKASVVAHAADAPYIDGSLPQPSLQRPAWLRKYLDSFRWSWAFTPVAVDLAVKDGDELPLLGGMQVIHTPGHTPGSICLWLKQKKVLIVGDLLANRFGLRLPALMFTADLAQEICSINRVIELDFEIICFGHGPPIREQARETVARFAARVTKCYSR